MKPLKMSLVVTILTACLVGTLSVRESEAACGVNCAVASWGGAQMNCCEQIGLVSCRQHILRQFTPSGSCDCGGGTCWKSISSWKTDLECIDGSCGP